MNWLRAIAIALGIIEDVYDTIDDEANAPLEPPDSDHVVAIDREIDDMLDRGSNSGEHE